MKMKLEISLNWLVMRTFTQLPLTDSELKFIYYYPDVAAKIMTVTPYYVPTYELKKRLESSSVKNPKSIV